MDIILPGKCQHSSQLTYAASEVYSILAEYLLFPLWELHVTHKHSDTEDILSGCLSQGSPNECVLDASAEPTGESN